MKFLVLLCTTLIVQCIALKSSDAERILAGVPSTTGWAGWIKRFYILIFLIPGVVLYYIPESRYYARKACHIIIDIVANGLKAALSGSFSNQTFDDVGRTCYYSEKFTKASEIQDSIIVANAQRDQLSPSHPRRRHRVKQDSKIDEDKPKGHDKKRHRHSERSRYGKDEKNRNVQHHQSHNQSIPKTTSKDPLNFHSDRTPEGFYYPETRKADSGPKYSTSFVISGLKTTSNFSADESNYKLGNIANLEEEEHRQMVSKQQSRPSKRTRPEDAIFPENEGPTRDCESFILTDLKESERSYDIESKIGFSTTTLDYPERECDAASHADQPHHEDSQTTVEEREDVTTDWETDADKRALARNEDVEIETAFPLAEGNRTSRIKEAAFPVRRVNFQKKEKERDRRKISDDEDNRPASTKSEEVLNQLGDQIGKLEKTIRMMKPEIDRKERGHRSREDHAVQNIETVLNEMKRSFSKVDEEMKLRKRSDPCREKTKDRNKRPFQHREDGQTIMQKDTESVTSFLDEYMFKSASSRSSLQPRQGQTATVVPGEHILTSDQDLSIFRSETLLEDDEEMVPIMTNRVKPYVIRTFNWLFTGCPGVSAENKYSVGKEGASKTSAE